MDHRREIDGLRTLAVLPVILFHAGTPHVTGGYVGVDVFFVISGFLITSIILSQRAAGNFSIATFYERRARRILPALFAVMAVSLPFAWSWMLPHQIKEFGQSLVAVSTFASNILFWKQSGYFDAAAELKPLLHTWSLAVEEQYYLLFPLLMALLWALGRRAIGLALVAIGMASLALAQLGVTQDPTATFYLLPTRAWELVIGALVALHSTRTDPPAGPASGPANALALLGVAMIGYGVFAFDNKTPFPSLYALLPTCGAALIILYARSSTWVGRGLSSKPIAGIGLISYSLYLWHQPVLAFYKLKTGRPDAWGWVLVPYLIATGVVAYLSYRWVEGPFRRPGRFSRAQIAWLSVACTAGFIGVGYTAHTTQGFLAHKLSSVAPDKRRLLVQTDLEVAKRADLARAQQAYLSAPAFEPGGASPRVLLIGDSLASDLAIALAAHRDMAPGQYRLLQLRTHCFDSDAAASRGGDDCSSGLRDMLASPLLTQSDLVVVTALWSSDTRLPAVSALLERLRAANGQLLVLGSASFLDIASLSYKIATDDRAYTQQDVDRLIYTSRRAKFDAGNESVKVLSSRLGIPYRDRRDLYCDDASRRCAILLLDQGSLLWDNAHLTARGMSVTAQRVHELGWLHR